MAEQSDAVSNSQQSQGEPDGEPETAQGRTETLEDQVKRLKAELEEQKGFSRKWEQRAKANKNAADELDGIRKAQMTDQQKAEATAKENEELKAQIASLEHSKSVAKWSGEAASKYRIPVELIRGEDEQQISEHAKMLHDWAAAITRPKAPAPGDEKQPGREPSKVGSGDWLRDLLTTNK